MYVWAACLASHILCYALRRLPHGGGRSTRSQRAQEASRRSGPHRGKPVRQRGALHDRGLRCWVSPLVPLLCTGAPCGRWVHEIDDVYPAECAATVRTRGPAMGEGRMPAPGAAGALQDGDESGDRIQRGGRHRLVRIGARGPEGCPRGIREGRRMVPRRCRVGTSGETLRVDWRIRLLYTHNSLSLLWRCCQQRCRSYGVLECRPGRRCFFYT